MVFSIEKVGDEIETGGYFVAQALSRTDIVLTHEIAENNTSKIKIPDVCIGLGVKSMTPYEMLRVEHARFVLG